MIAACAAPKTCKTCGATEGVALDHDWATATCTEAKTCATCGTTEGNALGHDWAEATVTDPKTCKRCGKTEGDPLTNDMQESESNDFYTEANKINVNADCVGNSADGHDNDWYVVTLPEDGYITLQFDHEALADSDTYWYMYLFSEDADEYIDYWSIYGDENKTTEQIALSAGTYYIKIEPYASYRYDMSRYILCVDFTTVP